MPAVVRHFMKHLVTTIFFFLTILFVNGQTIEKTFTNSWASTYWKFEFHKDGTFKRTSRGHYGNTVVEGTYKIYGDTLEVIRGFENTSRTVNQYYLLDGENCIIDTYLRYDYKTVDTSQHYIIYSDTYRCFKYPQVHYKDQTWKTNLDSVLNIAFNLPEVVKFLKFDILANRKPIFTNYYELNNFSPPDFKINERIPIFLPLGAIKEKFFIEITDINQNPDQIDIDFKIRGESKKFSIVFAIKNSKWTLRSFNKYDY